MLAPRLLLITGNAHLAQARRLAIGTIAARRIKAAASSAVIRRTKLERNHRTEVVGRHEPEAAMSAQAPSNTEKNPDDWVSGDEPMTGAQASYLKTLCEQAHTDFPGDDLTKADASKFIDRMRSKAGVA